MTITYVNSGEIKFVVNLAHTPALPAPGTATLTQGFDTTQLSNNQSTTSRYHNSTGVTTAYNGCVISLTKAGAFGFTLSSAAFNVAPDWWVQATFTCPNPNGMHKRNGWQDYWDSDYNISFTLDGHNVPAGTPINYVWTVPLWPQSFPYPGWSGSNSGQWKYLAGWSGSNSGQWKYLAGLTPGENTIGNQYYSAKVGDSFNYGISGKRNPGYGTGRSDDGKYRVQTTLGEVTKVSEIAFSY
jgi:hypothetical protein